MRKLKLENNNIKDIKNLNHLLGLNIKKIYLNGNPFIKDNPDYKNKLFDIFLSLICIDGTDKEGNDIESTEYENSLNVYEKIESKSIDEKIENNENNLNNKDNGSKSLSESIDYLEEENEIISINEEEEEEEEDDIEENPDKNNLNK